METKTITKQTHETGSQDNTLLSVNDLHMKYNHGKENEVYVLKGIDLQVNGGEMVAIMGPSGCGKTTLLNLIGGLDQTTSGQIDMIGSNLNEFNDQLLTEFRRHNIGYIFQLFNLFEDQTAVENVTLPLLLQYIKPSKAKEMAKMILFEVGLGDRLDNYPANLSGGEQQKVAIARALVTNPKLILADEPTGDLDMATSDDIMALFRRMLQENSEMGIIIVTHSEKIASQCDRIVRIENGRVDGEETNGKSNDNSNDKPNGKPDGILKGGKI